MILVTVKDKVIEITGHAQYDDYGKDIVCSAASSIVTTTINGILSINDKAISYELLKDKMIINRLSDDNITLKLIDNMMELLKKLSIDYPKNIKIKEGVK